MARKDLLKGLMQAAAQPEDDAAPLPRYSRGAIGAVSRGIEVLAHGVHDNDMARQASDHLPVWADIAFEPRSAAPEPGISGRIDGQLGE